MYIERQEERGTNEGEGKVVEWGNRGRRSDRKKKKKKKERERWDKMKMRIWWVGIRMFSKWIKNQLGNLTLSAVRIKTI